MKELKGLHHITCFTSDAQKTLDFYTNVLNLHLVKKTITQHDASKYHLYFANQQANFGSVVSFYEASAYDVASMFGNAYEAFSFVVANKEALLYWHQKLQKHDLTVSSIISLFDYEVFSFVDVNNITIYLFASNKKETTYELLHLGPVFINVLDISTMHDHLTQHFKFSLAHKHDDMRLYTNKTKDLQHQLIVRTLSENKFVTGKSRIDHVAFLVDDKDDLIELHDALFALGYAHSELLFRTYYYSLYTRLSNSFKIEFANRYPGFHYDEAINNLGNTLSLPEHLEPFREAITSQLKPLTNKKSSKLE